MTGFYTPAMASAAVQVTVIGAGVSGLTTALALQEAGFEVRVIAEAKGGAITSAAAGAIWYPYRVGPPERASGWSGRTREWLLELAASTPEAGVDVLTRVELADTEELPWWSAAAPDLALIAAPDPRIPMDESERPVARFAWQLTAPRCDPPIFMGWLERGLRRPVEIGRVESLESVMGDIVVNCTGLGARGLTGDGALQAIFGQTVITAPGAIDLRGGLGDERLDARIFYSIPRRAEVVLGGCAEGCADDRAAVPTREMTESILARARGFGLRPGAVIRESAGLRPYRAAVRLERVGRVIHNYGHGGAGYTLCRGCAEEVVGLARG